MRDDALEESTKQRNASKSAQFRIWPLQKEESFEAVLAKRCLDSMRDKRVKVCVVAVCRLYAFYGFGRGEEFSQIG